METNVDLAAILEMQEFDPSAYQALRETAFASQETLHRFSELLAALETSVTRAESPSSAQAVKLGLCNLAIGDPDKATSWLDRAQPGALRSYYLAQARSDQKRYADAIKEFEAAIRDGYDRLECQCRIAECFVIMEDQESAERILRECAGPGASSAYCHMVTARLHQQRGDFDAAVAEYQAALNIDPNHPQALFHLAYLLDLYGCETEAKELYVRCTTLPSIFTHALMNLAVIAEDACHYAEAAGYLRRVLAVRPNHARAQLYLKDVVAGQHMFIDEQQVKAQEKRDAVLDIPVTDFELSVRSRNCLKKMNINTLGELLRTSEAELLAYKNFGETSLREIKAMLAQKGLSLGQNAEPKSLPMPSEGPPDQAGAAPGDQEMLARSVSTMELSVRSRKCLQRLGINTIGELVARTEIELLESRNFGQTSLRDIKSRLSELGLTLRGGSMDPSPAGMPGE